MIKVTDILTKPVISLINAKTEGIVKNAVFDKNFKKLKYLILFDNNEHQEEKALNILNIYSYGENAIVIKEDSDLNLEISNKQILDKPFPINSNVYTYLGKFMGKVNDIILDEKYNIISLIVNGKEVLIENIISCGEDAVIIQDLNKKLNVKNIRRKKANKDITALNTSNLNKVYVLNNQNETNNFNTTNFNSTDIKNNNNFESIQPLNKVTNFNENTNILNEIHENYTKNTQNSIVLNNNLSNLNNDTIKTNINNFDENHINNTNFNLNLNNSLPTSISEKALNEMNKNNNLKVKYKLTDNPSTPKTVTTNYEFLIGRKLEKNIYAQNKELIARKNTRITKDIINKAKMYFKIRELTKYSKSG